jgi:hypothetical protein
MIVRDSHKLRAASCQARFFLFVFYLFYFLVHACNLKVMAVVTEIKKDPELYVPGPPGLCPSTGQTFLGPETSVFSLLSSISRHLIQAPCSRRFFLLASRWVTMTSLLLPLIESQVS